MPRWLTGGDTVDEDVVVSSRVRLARNIKNHRFPNRATADESAEIVEEVGAVMKEGNEDFSHFRLRDVDRVKRRVLMEQHLISPDLIKNRAVSEYYLKDDERMTLMVNEEDHLRMQSLLPGMQLRASFDAVMAMEKKLEEQLEFAWHMEFGYLTACPTNTGTGLRASVMVHLPALKYSHQLKGTFDSLGKVGLVVRGIYGEGSEALGDMFQISNQRTLGFTELEAIERLEKITSSLVQEERNVRTALITHTPTMVLDGVYRSLGILRYARVISARESLQHLSHVRAGVCMGLFPGADIRSLDDLMLCVQKYTMLAYKHDTKQKETEDEVRAQYIREYFNKEESYGKR